MIIRIALAASIFTLGACTSSMAPAAGMSSGHDHHKMHTPGAASARGNVLGDSGAIVGKVTAVQGSMGVLIRVEINAGGLTPGWHGIHLHAVGDCSDIGTFTISGGHHGKVEGGHGLMNPDGPEEGDLPNIWVGEDGAAKYETYSGLFELAPALDADGLALVIHEAADDHVTQPIGGAGARVACSVIEAGGS